MRVVIFAAVLWLALGARLNGATYFIDYSGGADANAGTSVASPWKHCPGDPAATGNAAACALSPGDTVHFRGDVTYVLTGSTGILLQRDGAPNQPIVYDGNSDGTWGGGRAKFTDNHGGNAITAFFATSARSHLAFRNLEFGQIGGSASLPPDTGAPVAPRFGGGIGFEAGATDVAISDCVFRELGYWSSQRPLSAESIAGTGIASRFSRGLSITRCEFSRVAFGCDFAQLDELSAVAITDCRFREALVWPIKLPSSQAGTSWPGLSVRGCDELEDHVFDFATWTGYGSSPRVGLAVVQANAPFTLTVNAIGSPAPTFQWRRNGNPIPGATNATLTISSTSLLDTGLYTVVASNSAGSAVSNATLLVVTPYLLVPSVPSILFPSGDPVAAPAITLQPISQTATALSTVTLTVAATGTAPTFQWLKNGVPINGATSATLTLSAVTTHDAATYTVVATNSAGSVTSRPATLTVSSLPTVSIQPSHLVATPFTTATFTAVVSGTPPVMLQWHKNGIPMPGATNSTLNLESITTNDVATYTVAATNSAGSVVSAPATLTVNSMPTVWIEPSHQIVTPLTTATFTATVGGTPPVTLQWMKNGIAMPGETATTLNLGPITTNDVATYTVFATNAVGTAVSNSAVLAVAEPPAPVSPPPAPPPPSTGDSIPTGPDKMLVEVGALPVSVNFTVSGSTTRRILVRASGPSLSVFGVSGALADPELKVYAGDMLLSQNDNWGGLSFLRTVFAEVGAFPLDDATSKDAVVYAGVTAGNYRAVISGVNGATGTVLLEVFELP